MSRFMRLLVLFAHWALQYYESEDSWGNVEWSYHIGPLYIERFICGPWDFRKRSVVIRTQWFTLGYARGEGEYTVEPVGLYFSRVYKIDAPDFPPQHYDWVPGTGEAYGSWYNGPLWNWLCIEPGCDFGCDALEEKDRHEEATGHIMSSTLD
jgi:hypothetical protein